MTFSGTPISTETYRDGRSVYDVRMHNYEWNTSMISSIVGEIIKNVINSQIASQRTKIKQLHKTMIEVRVPIAAF